MHRALEGASEAVPFAYWIGRLCEEFSCLPSEAFREWQRCPDGFLEHVIEARAYAKTKALYDAAPTHDARPTGPLADMVRRIEFDLVRADLADVHDRG